MRLSEGGDGLKKKGDLKLVESSFQGRRCFTEELIDKMVQHSENIVVLVSSLTLQYSGMGFSGLLMDGVTKKSSPP